MAALACVPQSSGSGSSCLPALPLDEENAPTMSVPSICETDDPVQPCVPVPDEHKPTSLSTDRAPRTSVINLGPDKKYCSMCGTEFLFDAYQCIECDAPLCGVCSMSTAVGPICKSCTPPPAKKASTAPAAVLQWIMCGYCGNTGKEPLIEMMCAVCLRSITSAKKQKPRGTCTSCHDEVESQPYYECMADAIYYLCVNCRASREARRMSYLKSESHRHGVGPGIPIPEKPKAEEVKHGMCVECKVNKGNPCFMPGHFSGSIVPLCDACFLNLRFNEPDKKAPLPESKRADTQSDFHKRMDEICAGVARVQAGEACASCDKPFSPTEARGSCEDCSDPVCAGCLVDGMCKGCDAALTKDDKPPKRGAAAAAAGH